MPKGGSLSEQIRHIRQKDERYEEAAYTFVLEALDYTIRKIGERRHLTGQELSLGIRQYAQEKFGLMARSVFSTWGIAKTDDFGEIVFNMISEGLMGKTEQDTREDFHNVYDFKGAFDESYRVGGQWKTN